MGALKQMMIAENERNGYQSRYEEGYRLGKMEAWQEMYEAGKDLETGITENVPEFVWMEETKSSTAKK